MTSPEKKNAPQARGKRGDQEVTSTTVSNESVPEHGANLAHPDLTEARRLFDQGFSMCKLLPNQKRPEGGAWNLKPVQTFDDTATGYGVMLAANGLCSVDPDHESAARKILEAFGFDLDAIMCAGVRSISTRPESGGRSAFKAAPALRWVKFATKGTGTILELRAASANLQDVVPGLIYLDSTGARRTQHYANCKRLDDAPELPADFLAWWQRLSTDLDFLRDQQRIAGEVLGEAPHQAISSGEKLAFRSPMRVWFNERHHVEDFLERHGYADHGGRYAPPTATGAPGVRPIKGKDGLWQSDHASDPLSGTFDAWTAFVVLEHDGNQEAAEAAAFDRMQAESVGEFDDLVAKSADVRREIDARLALVDVLGADDTLAEVRRLLPDADMAAAECDALIARLTAATERSEEAVKDALQVPRRRRFEPVQVGELARAINTQYLIKGVLPRAELAVLYGASTAGKSFVVLDMCFAIARGVAWREHRVRKGRVVYICAEGAGGFNKRLSAYEVHHELDLRGLPFFAVTDCPNFLGEDDKAVAEQIKVRGGADLIVVDTFAQVTAGGNENASEDVGKALGACKRLHRATGATVLVIHHQGKDATKGARGWSGLRAAVDAELMVECDEKTKARALHITKSKDGADGAVLPFRLHVVAVGTDEDGDVIDSCVIEHTDEMPPAPPPLVKGKHERLVVEVVHDLMGVGMEGPLEEEVIAEAVSRTPRPKDGKDRRRELVRRAIGALTSGEGAIFCTKGGRLVPTNPT